MNAKYAKLRHHEAACSFQQLPSELLLIIFYYCDASDLYFAIPFLSKSIYNLLKRNWVPEAELNHLIEPHSASKVVHNRRMVSPEVFFTTFSTTEENKLWKQQCIAHMPSFKLVTQDHLYCYRYLFLQYHSLEPPRYIVQAGLQRQANQFVESLRQLVKQADDAGEGEPYYFSKKNVTSTLAILQEAGTELQQCCAPKGVTNGRDGRSIAWGCHQSFTKYQRVVTFLRETCTVSISKGLNISPCFIWFLSPVNAKVAIYKSYDPTTASITYRDMLGTTLETTLSIPFSQPDKVISSIWKMITVLELLPSDFQHTKKTMMQMIDCIWFDVVYKAHLAAFDSYPSVRQSVQQVLPKLLKKRRQLQAIAEEIESTQYKDKNKYHKARRQYENQLLSELMTQNEAALDQMLSNSHSSK